MAQSRNISGDGIIISKNKYKESSLIFELFSPFLGKISIIAQGIRKAKSKFIGVIEPFNVVDFHVYKSENSTLFTLKEIHFKKTYNQQGHYERYIAASAAIEFISKIEFHEEIQQVYNLLILYLEHIQKIHKNLILIFWRFAFKLFELIGIPINLKICAKCKLKIDSFSLFDVKSHGFIHKHCSQENQNYLIITEDMNFILSNFSKIGEFVNKIEVSEIVKKKMNSMILKYFEELFSFDLNLKSLSFL